MKTGDLTIVYAAVAVIAVVLLISYILWEKKKEKKFLFLMICIAAVNCGYFLMSMAETLSFAMFANRLSYFGAAYSVLVMLMIISDVCQVQKKKWINYLLCGISTAAFLLAASGDWMGLYYTSVSIETINGMTRLVKEYGSLHTCYSIYLVSYILVMIMIIWNASRKKRLSSLKYTMLLMITVLLNMGIWVIEQAVDIEFEFLAVSYVVTEIILLLLYSIFKEYGIVQPDGALISVEMLAKLNTRHVDTNAFPEGLENMLDSFIQKLKKLSSAERRILNYYIAGYEIAEIPDLAFISIYTVKKHNHSIYQKLEVASRDELMLYIEMFRCCDRMQELMEE